MKLKQFAMLTLAALMLVSCNKDEINGNNPGPGNGEESVVSLTIYDATMGTRAAGTNEETPLPAESAINVTDGIKVIVFNDDGTLAYPAIGDPLTLSLTETSPGSGIYKSEEFKILSGDKYFYIFANDNAGKIIAPGTNTTRNQFLANYTAAELDSGTDELNLTQPNFLMGTLWSEKKEAPRGGIPGEPKNVPLTIGRLVSKVALNGIDKGTSSLMEGTFTLPAYRLGSIPKKIFLVGHNDESLSAPPAAGHGVVTSAVHDEPVYSGSGDPNFQQYTATWKAPAEWFYTVENTTAPDGTGTQYYGNTSYIQIRTVYTPTANEVSKVDDLTAKGSFSGPTFYTANLISTGERRLFEDDPRTATGLNPHADIDQASIKVYTDGLNYHKFPIHDNEAGLPEVQKNTVLRNHSYHYMVTSIGDIGDPDPDVAPPTPIETQTTLTLEVSVAPWSKIENNSVPI